MRFRLWVVGLGCLVMAALGQQRSPVRGYGPQGPVNASLGGPLSAADSSRLRVAAEAAALADSMVAATPYTVLDLAGAAILDTVEFSCDSSASAGRIAGESHPGGGQWFPQGLVWSAVLPIIGNAIVTTVAYHHSFNQPYHIPSKYSRECYEQGYLSSSRPKTAKTTFWASTIPTGALVLGILLMIAAEN